MTDSGGIVVFEIQIELTGIIDDFLPELVRVGGLILIAEDIQDFGVVSGLNKTIAGIRFEVQVYIFAMLAVLYRKLPLHLPKSHPRNSNPVNG